MGKGSNAPSDKDTTRMSGPWLPLQGPLKALIPQVMDLYDQGEWAYGQGTTAGWGQGQQQAFQQAMQLAGQGSPGLGQAYQFGSGVGSGANVGNAPGQDVLEGVAQNGFQNPATGAYGDLLGQAMGGSGGLDYLRQAAGGGFLGSNPYLEGQIDAASEGLTRRYNEAVMPGLETQMDMAGRSGANNAAQTLTSGANRDLLTGLGQIETGIRFGDYQNERGLQQQAGMALPGAFGQEIGTGLAAAGGASGNAWNDLQARMQAASGAGQGYRADVQQAMGAGAMLPSLYQGQFSPMQQAMQFGGMGQQQQERMMAEQQARLRWNQNEPWANLQRVLGTFQGVGGQANPTGGAALANQINQQESSGNSTAQTVGTLASTAAMMAMMFSDERLKTDLGPEKGEIGGVKRRRFRYLWEPEGVEHVGVMAQDAVRSGRGDAVAKHPTGYLMVDYLRLGDR